MARTLLDTQAREGGGPVWRAPIVAVSNPAGVATVKVGTVNIAEYQLEAGLGYLLDGLVVTILTVSPQLDCHVSRCLE